VTLLDNQTDTSFLTASASVNKYMVIEYSIERGSNNQIGRMLVVNNGTTASISDDNVNTASVGVTFDASISGSDIILTYSTTNTGNTGTLKLVKRRWT
jgi:hypothetical protein